MASWVVHCVVVSTLCGSSVDVGRALCGRWLGVSLRITLNWGVRILVLLARAVNGDLDSDLTALDLLAVHLLACLLLQLFTSERNEAKAAALAWLVAGLELAHHELGDGTESDLGGGRLVLVEDLEQLE